MAALTFQIIAGFIIPGVRKPVFRILVLPMVATLIGSIPLFINNYLTTNNPFTPPFWYYKTHTVPPGAQVWNLDRITQSISPEIPEHLIVHQDYPLHNLINLCLSIVPDFTQIDIFRSLVTVFFNPPPGNLSIFPITPIFLVGGLIFLIIALCNRMALKSIQKQDKFILLLLCLFLIGVILPYFHTMQGYIPGNRPGPDIRYFMPLYLIGGLIGLYPFILWCSNSIHRVFSTRNLGLLVLFPALVTGSIITTEPFGGPGDGYRGVYLIALYGLVLISIWLFFQSRRNPAYHHLLTIALILLISLPLIWQLTFSYYYAIGRFNGYPYWVPIMEYLYEAYVPYAWK
jgi:hypothetical protein